MEEKEKKDSVEKSYGKRPMWQWVLIYVLAAIIIYGLIYYFFFRDSNNSGGGYGY